MAGVTLSKEVIHPGFHTSFHCHCFLSLARKNAVYSSSRGRRLFLTRNFFFPLYTVSFYIFLFVTSDNRVLQLKKLYFTIFTYCVEFVVYVVYALYVVYAVCICFVCCILFMNITIFLSVRVSIESGKAI